MKKFEYSQSEFDESFRTPYFALFTNMNKNKGQYSDIWEPITRKYANDDTVIFSEIACQFQDEFCSKYNIKLFPYLTMIQRGYPKGIEPRNSTDFDKMIQDEIKSEKILCRIFPDEIVSYPAVIYGREGKTQSEICDELTQVLDNVQDPYKYGYVQINKESLRLQVNKNKEIPYTGKRSKSQVRDFIFEYSKRQLSDYSINASKSSTRRVAYIIYHPDNLSSIYDLGKAADEAVGEAFVPLMDVNEFNLFFNFSGNSLANVDVPALLLFSKQMKKYSIRTRFMDDVTNFSKFLEDFVLGDYDREMFEELDPLPEKMDFNPKYRLAVSLLCVGIVISFIIAIVKGLFSKSEQTKLE
ncbi:hypothetical protein TVAG_363180 [Trichomonas vaginalis G3]|uniref:Thioredoxin domain-containing protein n=1 Tax=Trichomonas vaginalis (strain ATCC PRA-98 / G3) TaxID=412133 RepID=A2FQH9_TRIV3|nr:intramolecular oxidoreductase activity, transposing S-S bonds [Trichomonas vaginalis G3]EAX92840.1 hypothetical protein TVAG_363180 [Trichomonas vaginalis G3]KAI5499402.1 intramolecular oxidoreductase activity, transposing S-S bonds [Trichomonas vaginalis G3]|eukprot:XP_001305770.1 hypothetical protein [Trichomonas vaginalis G3]